MADRMRALTLWPEWLPAFTVMDKDIENRTWRPLAQVIGTRIALHAGASIGGGSRIRGLEWLADTALEAGWDVLPRLDLGNVLEISPDPIPPSAPGSPAWPKRVTIPLGAVVATALLRDAVRDSSSRWAMPGQWHWQLDELEVFDTPIAAKGHQGFWWWERP